MSPIKNILLISTEFPPGPGGIGNHAWNIARQLDKKFPVEVVTISDYVSRENCLEFDKQNGLYIHRFNRYFFPMTTYLMRIGLSIKKFTVS